MKKIIQSALMVFALSAVMVGATNAFFEDKETSKGNILTAGDVDLQIDYTSSYNGINSVSWPAKDLTEDKFFDFNDIKPGDRGEGTISIHNMSNDAWLCLSIGEMKNEENVMKESEIEAGDTTGDTGELASNVEFFAWADTDGDNLWESGEFPLFSNTKGPAEDVLNGVTYALADATTSTGPIKKTEIKYIGIEWCAGLMTVHSDTNTIDCDGSAMGGETQTDSLSADITFTAVQHKNNDQFACSSLN